MHRMAHYKLTYLSTDNDILSVCIGAKVWGKKKRIRMG